MRWLVLAVILALGVSGRPAVAADDIRYGPAPGWVKPLTIPVAKASNGGDSYQLVAMDKQTYFHADGEELYVLMARKVLNTQGLRDLGTLFTEWDPASQVITIHRASILRGDETIDLLSGGERFSSLRREKNLAQAVLDGTLTAILEVKGLRVGDIILFETSFRSNDPILGGHAETTEVVGHAGIVGALRYRHVWPKARPIRWKASEHFGEVKVSEANDEVELTADYVDIAAPAGPDGAPPRFAFPARLDLTDYGDWSDISRIMAPLFKAASTLADDSPVRAEARKIMAAHQTPQARALAALRLVESDIRYLALTMGSGGLVPAHADATWSRRFGDCKAKTALLVALLGEMGIKAEAALVDSDGGDGLDERLPQMWAFDHVIVRAEIDGQVYWLDATRTGDRDLALAASSDFRWALPVGSGQGGLEKVAFRGDGPPLMEVAYEYDASGGFDAVASLRLVILLRGDKAAAMEELLAGKTSEEAQALASEIWKAPAPDFRVDKLEHGWDQVHAAYRLDVQGKSTLKWAGSGANRQILLSSSFEPEFERRQDGPYSDAPFSLTFPYHTLETGKIRLPKGARFNFSSGDVDVTAGQVRYQRKAEMFDGEATYVATVQALASETDLTEGLAAVKTFKASAASNDLVLRATGLGQATTPSQAQVVELLALARKNIAAEDYEAALPYLDRAIRLDSRNVEAYLLRMNTLYVLQRFERALKDTKVLQKIDKDGLYGISESYILMALDRNREALAIANRMARANPGSSTIETLRAPLFAFADRPSDVAASLDVLLSAPRDDLKTAWGGVMVVVDAMPAKRRQQFIQGLAAEPQSASARYLHGLLLFDTDVGLASKQFDQALLIQPNFAMALMARVASHVARDDLLAALADADALVAMDSDTASSWAARAEVHAKMKTMDKATSDFDAAIKLAPDDASVLNSSCFMRAVANYQLERALADCEQAVKLEPEEPAYLDSRGFVHLRMDRHAQAIADYDKAIEVAKDDPYAESLFGRGLAKKRSGDGTGSSADIDRAVQIDPTVAATFAGYGLTP